MKIGMKNLKLFATICFVFVSFLSQAKSKDYLYRSGDGSVQHGIYFYESNRVPEAAVLFVHGMQSHAEWVRASNFGDDLAASGIDVFAYDRRGSGKSTTKMGDAPSADQLINDMEEAVRILEDQLQRRYGANSKNIQVHIMANCFGARIAVPYLLQTPEMNQRFASLVLIAPSTHMTPKASYNLEEKAKIFTALPWNYFKTPLQDEWFVSSGPGLKWINQDPGSLRMVTKRFLMATNKLTKIMEKNIRNLPIPLMIIMGKHDEMVDLQKVKSEVFDAYLSPKRFVTLDSGHSLEFGKSADKFVDESVDWFVGTGVDLRNQD